MIQKHNYAEQFLLYRFVLISLILGKLQKIVLLITNPEQRQIN